MNFGPNSPLWAVFFWVNIVVCVVLVILVVRIVYKYEAKRRQLKNDVQAPGLKNIRWLFKHKLKEHSIHHDENEHDVGADVSQN